MPPSTHTKSAAGERSAPHRGMLQNKLPEDVVHDIIRGAVEAERKFICDALPCDLIGMNIELMTRPGSGPSGDDSTSALQHVALLDQDHAHTPFGLHPGTSDRFRAEVGGRTRPKLFQHRLTSGPH